MASLPPRQPQRRQSPVQRPASPSSTAQPRERTRENGTSDSSDSHTVLLNDPSYTADSSKDAQQASYSSQQDTDDEPRKCWICFQDETEDTPESSQWRTPCPCALTAHESCLLDWIADMESPEHARSAPATVEIRCPQCKSEIQLARPRSVVLEAVSRLEKIRSKLIVPVVLGGFSWTVVTMAMHHGEHTIRMIFDERDAGMILGPQQRPGPIESWLYRNHVHLSPDWRGFRVQFGLPTIPLALVASRTNFADAFLPFLPIIFFVTDPRTTESITRSTWPPSAALAFVVLPYIRGMYEEYMQRVWAPRERAWMKEIRPRLNDNSNNNDDDIGDGIIEQRRRDHGHDHEEEVVEIEVGIDLGIFGGEQHEQREQAPDREVPNLEDPPVDDNDAGEAAPAPNVPQNRAQRNDGQGQGNGQGPAQAQQRRETDILISGTRIAETIIGALLFPTLSAGAGQFLSYLLPASWVTPPRSGPATGLLQKKWGRSVVGGCLLVVLKDVVRIYCRWKRASMHRQRRVVDYDRTKNKKAS